MIEDSIITSGLECLIKAQLSINSWWALSMFTAKPLNSSFCLLHSLLKVMLIAYIQKKLVYVTAPSMLSQRPSKNLAAYVLIIFDYCLSQQSRASDTKSEGFSYISCLSDSVVFIKLRPTSRIKFGRKRKNILLNYSNWVVRLKFSSASSIKWQIVSSSKSYSRSVLYPKIMSDWIISGTRFVKPIIT